MCGIFGYGSTDNRATKIETLQGVATVTMRRGPHAWGLAWIDGRGVMHAYKQTGRIVDDLGILKMARDARVLIGHCRYATHGSPGNNLNNHPHPADGGWIVHNGVVGNYRDIIEQNNLNPITDCDSEVLGLLIERVEGTLADRCYQAADFTDGSPLAMLGLWKPGRVVAVRMGNPLHCGIGKSGIWLGSLADELPGKVRSLADGEVLALAVGKSPSVTLHRQTRSAPRQREFYFEGRRGVEECEPCKTESGVRLIGKTRPRFR